MILEYTTPAQIRAVLGVDEVDVDDSTITLPIYENYLVMELEDIDIDFLTTYATKKASTTRTAQEHRFVSLAQVFATFVIAKQLTGSLPLFALKQESDGKAQATRFDNPYRDTIQAVNRDYEKTKGKLVAAIKALGSASITSTPRVYFGTIGLGTDPITNS